MTSIHFVTSTARRRLAAALILAGSIGAAGLVQAAVQNPPPTPVPTYDVKIDVDQTYTGTTTFAADQDGKVTGTMHIDAPAAVDAKLSGLVKDGTWTFDYEFSMPSQNCTGKSTGTATISADRSVVSGNLTVSGDCVPQPTTGTFTFTKKKS